MDHKMNTTWPLYLIVSNKDAAVTWFLSFSSWFSMHHIAQSLSLRLKDLFAISKEGYMKTEAFLNVIIST